MGLVKPLHFIRYIYLRFRLLYLISLTLLIKYLSLPSTLTSGGGSWICLVGYPIQGQQGRGLTYRIQGRFNRIRKLQLVSIGRDNLFNLIKASVFLIKFLNRLFCVQISCIQLDKVTNLVSWCQGLVLIYYGFINRLGLCYFISKELLQFFHLLYKFVCFYNL